MRRQSDDVVLVTGAAGFIGSHIVDALVASGRPVRALDVLGPASCPQPSEDPRVDWIIGDLRDRTVAAAAVDGVGCVCHQAGVVGVERGIADAPRYVDHNDGATARLLAALAETRFEGRLLLAGSMVVYGEGRYTCTEHGEVPAPPRAVAALAAGRYDPDCPRCGAPLSPSSIPETAAPDPRSVYAATKVHQEHLCQVFARERGVALTVLRYHNVYGPRMPPDTSYAGVASVFCSAIAAGRAPRVFEDGRQLRDFVHVRDVARANLLAVQRPEPAPGTFNIASGRPRTVVDMARAMATAGGPEAPGPAITGEYRLGDVRHIFASAERAAAGLGFRAEIAFEDGMAELADAPPRRAVLTGT